MNRLLGRLWTLGSRHQPTPAASLAAGSGLGWPATLDPAQFRQTTPTTCGSMSLLAADRLLHAERSTATEESVARWTRGGRRQGVGWVWPWPRSFGTSPWAAAKAMTRITGRHYRVVRVDPSSRQSREDLLPQMQQTLARGLPVPAFVGNDALPRHVVLITGLDDAGLQILEPAAGAVVPVSVQEWRDSTFTLGGWNRLWAVVVPLISTI